MAQSQLQQLPLLDITRYDISGRIVAQIADSVTIQWFGTYNYLDAVSLFSSSELSK